MAKTSPDPTSFAMWDKLLHESGTHILCIQGLWRMGLDDFNWLKKYNKNLNNPFMFKPFGGLEYHIYDIPVKLAYECQVPELVFRNHRRWQ